VDGGGPALDVVEVLTWLHLSDGESVDWQQGALLLAFGLIGALVTLYFTSPDKLPAVGGTDSLSELADEVQHRRRQQADNLDLRRSMVGSSEHSAKVKDLGRLFADDQEYLVFLTAQWRAQLRSVWRRAVPLFLVLGPAGAAIVAATVWQAFLIGTIGPTALSAFAARREVAQTKNLAAEEVVDVARQHGDELADAQARARGAEQRLRDLQVAYDAAMGAFDMLRERRRPPDDEGPPPRPTRR
jgi:hypothetical protein